MRRTRHPKVFRGPMLVREGLDYRIEDGSVVFATKLRKNETYTVFWYPKDPGRYELYDSFGNLKERGVLEFAI